MKNSKMQSKQQQVYMLRNRGRKEYLKCHKNTPGGDFLKGNIYVSEYDSQGRNVLVDESGKKHNFGTWVEAQEFFEVVPYNFKKHEFIL